MKIERLERQGEMYLKSGKYAFAVSGRLIEKMYMLTDEKVESFVLPDLGQTKVDQNFEHRMYDYVNGSAIFYYDRFEELPDSTIIVPSTCSLKLTCEYTGHVKLKLVLPKNMELFTITQTWDSFDGDEQRSWTLVADKKLGNTDSFNSGDLYTYYIEPYNDKSSGYEHFTVEHFD